MENKSSSERVRKMREKDKGKFKTVHLRVENQTYEKLMKFMGDHSIKDYRGFFEFILSGKYVSENAHWEMYQEISQEEFENNIENIWNEKIKYQGKYFASTGASGHKALKFYLDETGSKQYINLDEFL